MIEFKFGDFVKTQCGTVLRVIHVPSNETDKFALISEQGGFRWVSSGLTPLPDYVDFDGPAEPAKRAPVYVPWTFETMPIAMKVYFRGQPRRQRLAAPVHQERAQIGEGYETYQFLFDNYVQLDGSPCGQLQS